MISRKKWNNKGQASLFGAREEKGVAWRMLIKREDLFPSVEFSIPRQRDIEAVRHPLLSPPPPEHFDMVAL